MARVYKSYAGPDDYVGRVEKDGILSRGGFFQGIEQAPVETVGEYAPLPFMAKWNEKSQ